MTAMRGYMPASSGLGVHSLDQFVIAVADLKPAEAFYGGLGLDARTERNALALRTFGNDHVWGVVIDGPRKRLHHVSFGCYPDDLAYLQMRVEEENGVEIVDPPEGFESNGFWFRDPAGVLIEVKVAPKTSADHKMAGTWSSCPEGVAGAPVRGKAPPVRPRRLSHMLMFTPDVDRAIDFYSRNLGLRLSDRSDAVAFMHAIHGSDHHILAFAQSNGPGMHHCSWDVGGIEEIGLGAMQMHDKGYRNGWGLGRHVLGSNYFHYVQDPWGSFAEYSADIDYIPKAGAWEAGYHAPENSFYLWGPEPPADFVHNYEI
ncbi:MAG TPA: VOC family protein [Xanthobacteraceae bacterium]|nr:VOC family protein [Xanthobacteraceae bacterium]